MYRNTLRIKLNHKDEEKEFNLRLTIGSQLKLKKKYGEEGIQLIMSAIDDIEMLTELLSEALSFKNNENSVTNGEDFYEILVDNGFCGKEAFADLIFKIAAASGIIKDEQSEKLSSMIGNTYESLFDSLNDTNVLEAAAGKEKSGSEEGETTTFRK